MLNDLTERYHNAVVAAYQAKDSRALDRASQRFMELISDMDELLATRKEFLLGRWLGDAKRWARTDQQRRLYEVNARDLITRWGGRITDYSQRQWSGMLTGFYQPRWAKFLDRLQSSLTGGEPFSAAQLRKEFEVWEEKWTRQRESYPAEPAGDSIAVARRLLDKYRQEYQPEALSLTTGKPTICSAALPGYPAHLANDGRRRDTNRYWATDITQDKAAWWQVDLEKPTTIARIVVVFYYGDKRHYGFTVETSTDAKTWQIAADHRDNTELSTPAGVTVRFTPRPARYIRIILTSNSANTGRRLVEVMAYDK